MVSSVRIRMNGTVSAYRLTVRPQSSNLVSFTPEVELAEGSLA